MKLDLDTLYEVKREIFRQMASTSRDHVYGMALAKRIVSGMIEEVESTPQIQKCGGCGRNKVTGDVCYSCAFNTAHELEIVQRKKVDDLLARVRDLTPEAKNS